MKRTYLIFGLPIHIEIEETHKKSFPQFFEQFEIYTETDETPKVEIYVGEKALPETVSSNPSIHALIANGFVLHDLKYSIAYQKVEERVNFQIKLKSQSGTIISYLKKLNNIQYNSLEERLVQIIWENCLYILPYFLKNLAPIHSSGFSIDNSKVLLLGGTGGVGKTSLELALAEEPKVGFMNDDIAIINRDGLVFHNHSWPKIYAYNLEKNPKIEALVLGERALHDRFAWTFKKQIFGVKSTRRTLDPRKLFPNSSSGSLPLKTYILLKRGNYQKLAINPFEKTDIAEINNTIMKSEFINFECHLNWHKYNSILADKQPICDSEKIHTEWKNLYNSVFKNVDCYVLEIPTTIDHRTFMHEAKALILSVL